MKPKIIGCVVTNPRLREPTPVIIDTAAILLSNALTIPAPALTSSTSTVEKSAMTQPPQQPPTQAFAQQRRSGCGTLLVALLVLAIITAIVIVLGALGWLDWIFS
jgi:magnesium-transporting ATPase (P-type)